MKSVLRYPLPFDDCVELDMPADAIILSVGYQKQRNSLSIWAVADDTSKTIKRKFRITGTGHPLELDGESFSWNGYPRFIGTVMVNDEGTLVFHVFEM